MKKLILTFSFLVLLFGTLQASVSIIPMPQKCIEKRGNFTVNDKTVITLSVDNEEMLYPENRSYQIGRASCRERV